MTCDSSLSQTQNSHSIYQSHPITDCYSPWKMERLEWEMKDLKASRHWTPGRVGSCEQEEHRQKNRCHSGHHIPLLGQEHCTLPEPFMSQV